jgi:hypothetical protein
VREEKKEEKKRQKRKTEKKDRKERGEKRILKAPMYVEQRTRMVNGL